MPKSKPELKRFLVEVPEVWYSTVEIMATDDLDAVNRALDGKGTYLDGLEYSHTLTREEFKVKKDA